MYPLHYYCDQCSLLNYNDFGLKYVFLMNKNTQKCKSVCNSYDVHPTQKPRMILCFISIKYIKNILKNIMIFMLSCICPCFPMSSILLPLLCQLDKTLTWRELLRKNIYECVFGEKCYWYRQYFWRWLLIPFVSTGYEFFRNNHQSSVIF